MQKIETEIIKKFFYINGTRGEVETDGRLESGSYEFRFFPYKCGYTYIGKSNIIEVVNRDKLEILITRENNSRMKKIAVSYEVHSLIPSSSDWIALYKKGSQNNNYISYNYISPKGVPIEFDAPKELSEYEFRYHSATFGKNVSVVSSPIFTVEDTDTVIVTIEGSIFVRWDIHSQVQTTSDWVGLFKASEKNNGNYLESKYVNVSTNNTVFKIPKDKPGEYEVRYFSYYVGKYVNFKKSNIFVVQWM